MAGGEQPKGKSKVGEYIGTIVAAVILALIIRSLVVQSYHIPSESMEDTLLKGDFLFANKFIYGAKVPFTPWHLPKARDPKPGDIVIFKFPGDRKTDYIKRCVAVEGQTVELREKTLYIDGVEKPEPYAKYIYGDMPRRNYGPYLVPKGFIVVLGDNRDNSYDSRSWGAVDTDLLRGEALFLYFSVDYQKHWIRFGRIGKAIH